MLRVPYKMLLAPVPQFRLARQNAALLLLDPQRMMADRGDGLAKLAKERGIEREFEEYYAQADAALRNMSRLLAACRSRGLRVFYSILLSTDQDGADVGRQMRTSKLPIPSGEPRTEICQEVRPAAEDVVLTRGTYSPFARSDLEARLREAEIDTLLVAGMLANTTVALAAQEAADRDFGAVVVRDACASETLAWHAQTMTALVGGLIRVRTTQQVIEMLEGTRT